MVPRVLGLAGFVLFLPLSSTHSCGGDNVKVTLVVILASEEGNKIDKRLATIADEIRKHEPKLKSFHLKSMTTKSLAPGEKMPFALIEDKNALVVIKHGADKENRVSLAVTAPNQAEIVYRCVCGKFLPIITRYYTKSKERLILAVRVQPCND